MRVRIMSIDALLQENNKLASENIVLKKQIEDIKIRAIAKEVAKHVNDWLDSPYREGVSEQQDVEDFALRLTKTIDHKLRD